MRKPKLASVPKPAANEENTEQSPSEPEMVAAPTTGMTVEQALGNLRNVARAVQGTAQTHELLAESVRVVSKACGLPV